MKVALPEHFGDGVPTYAHYPDMGCEYSPKCLECPLPECKYDVFGYTRKVKLDRMAGVVFQLRCAGLTEGQIAASVGIGIRTVQRYLKRCNNG